jgi:non-ribosomal peptide synthase protein (TIGR01720 family)
VDVEGHGRAEEMFDGIDLSRTVGWFTSIYPVRLDLEGIEGAAASLRHIKECLRKIPHGGIGYGVLRYLRSAAGEVESRAEAEVSFNYLGQIDNALEEDSLFGAAPESPGPLQSERGRRRYLLEVTMAVVGGRLQVQWSYGARLHARETVERLAGDYLAALRRLIEDCRGGQAEEFAGPDLSLAGFGEGDLAAILSEAEFEGVGGDQIR